MPLGQSKLEVQARVDPRQAVHMLESLLLWWTVVEALRQCPQEQIVYAELPTAEKQNSSRGHRRPLFHCLMMISRKLLGSWFINRSCKNTLAILSDHGTLHIDRDLSDRNNKRHPKGNWCCVNSDRQNGLLSSLQNHGENRLLGMKIPQLLCVPRAVVFCLVAALVAASTACGPGQRGTSDELRLM